MTKFSDLVKGNHKVSSFWIRTMTIDTSPKLAISKASVCVFTQNVFFILSLYQFDKLSIRLNQRSPYCSCSPVIFIDFILSQYLALSSRIYDVRENSPCPLPVFVYRWEQDKIEYFHTCPMFTQLLYECSC